MYRSEPLTLREALASNQLEAFVRQEQTLGVELAKVSELERALARLITQRRTALDQSFGCESPIGLSEVRYWHLPDIQSARLDVRSSIRNRRLAQRRPGGSLMSTGLNPCLPPIAGTVFLQAIDGRSPRSGVAPRKAASPDLIFGLRSDATTIGMISQAA
jgi:hypothetical protein